MLKTFLKARKLDLFSDKLRHYSNFGLLKKIAVVSIFSLISVLLINKFLLSARIYIPGLYFVAQTAAYQFEDVSLGGIFSQRDFLFFIVGFVINIPLIFSAYFLIGKRYAWLSLMSLSIWTFFGLLFAVETIKSGLHLDELEFFQFAESGSERTQQVQYYVIALSAGLISGFGNSFIWRQNVSMGGLDVIFTYLSVKKKKEIQNVTIPTASFFAVLSIVINEYSQEGFNLQTFLSLFFASLLFLYVRNLTINYLYPKYRIISVLVVTKKPELVRKELRNFYLRGGNMVKSLGLYDQSDKTIIITAMTYLERDIFVNRVKKIDPQAFFIGFETTLLKGKFAQEH